MAKVKPLKWLKQDSAGYWYTEDGKYRVWLQAHPREDGPQYAASVGDLWICRYAYTSREAKKECAEHAAGIPKQRFTT